MIDHFEIKTVNFEACKIFYASVLNPLGIELKWSDEAAAGFGLMSTARVSFLIEKFDKNVPAHIAFSASDKQSVDLFHHVGVQSGFTCNGPPGLREDYALNYYAAFLFDPDGNNVEAVTYL